ncbi:abnormal spindle-like microcephaly-associated protein [Protopterus annectens]|uniref:abnormal spindle-like microcephaly-associated protein n=1 Tax=Protopterus annectens TaxID=7888 RepID=UPI001CF9CC4A|nr:abnormal spindle-like microcephaly-associated protein [Protopterus annectens]
MAGFVKKGVLLDISPTERSLLNAGASVRQAGIDKQCHPVLSLTHFCRPPFVSFDSVRVGTSRSGILFIENPSEHLAEVFLDKFPSAKGFSVDQRHFVLQPAERVPISITWTPVEEGGVRELITFAVNGSVKVQAVLLGKAEQPQKKKKNIVGVRTRKISKGPVYLKTRKNEFHLNAVNSTFDVSINMKSSTGRRVRSPLQSCENVSIKEGNTLTAHNSKYDPSDRVPILSVSPLQKQVCDETSTPQSLWRYKMCSVFTSTETKALHGLKSNLNFTVDLQQKQVASTIKNEGSTEQCIIEENEIYEPTKKSTLLMNHTLSPIGTPDSQISSYTPLSQRRILSPDSFLNDSYVPDGETDLAVPVTVLSPDQFLKDTLVTVQPASLHCSKQSDILSKSSTASTSVSDESSSKSHLKFGVENSEINRPPLILSKSSTAGMSVFDVPLAERHNKFGVEDSVCLKSESNRPPVIHVEKAERLSSRLTYFEKSDLPLQGLKGSKELLILKNTEKQRKRPVLSATVVKNKAVKNNACPDMESKTETKTKPSSRKCLNLMNTDNTEKNAVYNKLPECHFQGLPIIESSVSSNDTQSSSDIISNLCQKNVFRSRKRKSGEHALHESASCKIMKENKNKVTSMELKSSASARSVSLPLHAMDNSSRKQRNGRCTLASAPLAKSQMPKTRKIESRIRKVPTNTPMKSSKAVAGVAQSKLTFVKPVKTVIPRHPMPFAAKNMFYDERWKEKQEKGFTWWLNFILTPEEFTVDTNSSKAVAAALILGSENLHKVSVAKAPTKEEVSLRAYTAKCRLNRLRRAACRLFTSESMVKAIRRLEIEIDARRLLVRKDRHLWKDIGEREKVLNWLLSYNPLWLRIGLETVYGELISLENNSDVVGLVVFILNRLLWNPDLAAEYRHPSVPHLYREGHETALSRFTLKKLILLVCFLDLSKRSRLIDHDPCLFCKDAVFKASKDILLAFSRDFLSGEGDLSRHLSLLGLPVSHVQTPRDEFDFAVTNLAVDLRCGIRLVRTLELLTQNWNLSKKVRVPAVSRLQKMHNVDVALNVLKEHNISLTDDYGHRIDCKDIVDGYRERTLALLWRLVFAFQVEILLNVDQLKEEIDFLTRTLRVQQKLASLASDSHPVLKERRESSNVLLCDQSSRVKLLMEWVNAVLAFYNTRVENFTVPFSDGRVFCYLIHHYQPSYLGFEDIHQRTTQTVECNHRGSVGLNSSASDSSLDTWLEFDQTVTTSALYKELLENEKHNFEIVSTAVAELGGVPAMVHHAEMSNTIPDEKVVVVFLTFLCARLLDLRKEARAARVIQAAWRKYLLKKELRLKMVKDRAAKVIQAIIRKFLLRRQQERLVAATVLIQAVWRAYLARKELQELKSKKLKYIANNAAIVIQAWWRRHLARKKFQQVRHYTVLMQAHIRRKIACSAYKRIYWATVIIQRYVRAWIKAKADRRTFLTLKTAACVIQYMFRRWKKHKLQMQTKAAVVLQSSFRKWQARKMRFRSAVVIQSWYKMHRGRQQYLHIRNSILRLQSWYRGCRAGQQQRAEFIEMKAAAVTLQAAYHGYVARKMIHRWNDAAHVIQSTYRMFRCRKRFKLLKCAALVVQRHFRNRLVRKQQCYSFELCSVALSSPSVCKGRYVRSAAITQHQAAVVIQSYYRMYAAQKKLRLKRSAALVIQRQFRAICKGRAYRFYYLQARRAAVTLQRAYRRWKYKKFMQRLYKSATVVQAVFKCYILHKRFKKLKAASAQIQRWYRRVSLYKNERYHYLLLRSSVVKIQATYRGIKVRKEMQKMHKAATVIQTMFRMHKSHASFQALKAAVVIIQSHYRAYRRRREDQQKYLTTYKAVVVVQSLYRGMKVRQQLNTMHKAATTIQSFYRMHKQRSHFRKLHWAAVVMQQRYRARQSRNIQVEEYRKLKKAAVCIQSTFRNMKTRRQFQTMHKAATVLQSNFKACVKRRYYIHLKAAAITVQQCYRARLVAKKQRQEYLHVRKAVTAIQAAYRGMKVRQQIQQRDEAATIIQTLYRMHRVHISFCTLNSAAIIIQRHYKAYRKGKEERQMYVTVRKSAVIIQAFYRGVKVRQHLRMMQKAATVIQCYYRMHRQHSHFRKLCWAAIVVQQRYRSLKTEYVHLQDYSRMKKSAICIQSTFHGMKTRRQLKTMHKAATVIQSNFKAYAERRRYCCLRTAAVTIQRRYRAAVHTKQQREDDLSMQKAAIILEAGYRGMKVRRQFKHLHQAATVIQAAFRMRRLRIPFLAMKAAAIIIQKYYRAYHKGKEEQQQYLRIYTSAVVIQSFYRGMKVRKQLKIMHKAATVLQSHYRMYREQKYKKFCYSALLIQQRYRALKAGKVQLQEYHKMKKAAICIQSAFRSMKVRRHLHEMHKAASVLQSNFRAYAQRKNYCCLKSAAVTVQRWYRAAVLGKREHQVYLCFRRAVITLQAAYRGWKVRSEIKQWQKAATVIQATFKMHQYHTTFLALKTATVIIQRHFRDYYKAKIERENYVLVQKSAVIIQAYYRGMKVRQQLRKMHKAATLIQSVYRMNRQSSYFQKLRWAAVVLQQRHRALVLRNNVKEYRRMRNAVSSIQSAFHSMKKRKQLEAIHAATVIQSAFKAYAVRRKYFHLKACTIAIQQWYRVTVLAKQQRQEYVRVQKAAITLQAAYRGMKARQQIQESHYAAAKIQATFRMSRLYVSFQTMKAAAVVIQVHFRAYVCGRSDREKYLKLRNSAIFLQAAYRGMKARCELQEMQNAATKIQAHYRMHRCSFYYKRLCWAARVIQESYRACKARETASWDYACLKKAAVVIQSAFRGMKARKKVKELRQAATVIQRAFKTYTERKKYLGLRAAVISLQTQYWTVVLGGMQHQKYLSICKAAVAIQAAYRGFRVRKKVKQMHMSATCIQAAFRMHKVRKEYQSIKWSAVIIQRRYRAHVSGKVQHQKYLAIYKATVLIQSRWRGLQVQQQLKVMHWAATVIQSHYRMHRQRTHYMMLCRATKMTQQMFRARSLRDAEVWHYNRLKKAAVCIQSAFRAKKARQLMCRTLAAQRIQSFLLMSIDRKHFLRKKAAAIVLQSMFRGYRERVNFKLMQYAAVVIQRQYRAWKLMNSEKTRYQTVKQAAVIIQSAFRGMAARNMVKRKVAAVRILAFLRMAVCRRKFLQLRSAAVLLQAQYRAHCARKLYLRIKCAVLTLQKYYRACASMKKQRMIYLKTRASIIFLQSRIRGFVQSRRFQTLKKSTVAIQKYFRGFIQRRKFLHYKNSAIVIQQYYRAHCLRKTEQQKYLDQKNAARLIQGAYRRFTGRQTVKRVQAACRIQACFRGYKIRRELRDMKKAAVTICGFLQARIQRARFLKIRTSVVVIQKRWREIILTRKIREEFLTARASAIKIQATFRGFKARRQLAKENHAATLIKATYKGFKQRALFLKQRSAVLIMQKYVCAWQKGKAERITYKRTKKAVITIQAFVRSWLVRKKIADQRQADRRLHFTAAAYHHLCAVRIQRTYRAYSTLKRARSQMHSIIFIQRLFRAGLQQRRFQQERLCIVRLQRRLRAFLARRNKAATTIQSAVRQFLFRKQQRKVQNGVMKIQALWKGYCWRKYNDTNKIIAVRHRLEQANRESKEENKLFNRTVLALDYLLKYSDLAYILAALKHLEVATRLSSVCCEYLVQSGAIINIFILIRSCNRSVPCMEIIKYAIQVLLNLSKYEKTTEAVYDTEHSVETLLDLMQIYREKAGDKLADKGGSIFTKVCCLVALLLQNRHRALEIRNMPEARARICSIYRLTARKHKMDAARAVTKWKMSSSLNSSTYMPSTPVRTKMVSRIQPDWVLRKDNMKEVVDPLQAIQMVVDTLGLSPVM